MSKINQMQDFTFKHSEQVDRLYEVLNSNEIKSALDSRGTELREFINGLVELLNSEVDGNSGADNISMTPIVETGNTKTVQSVIEALITLLKSSNGAALIGTANVDEFNGNLQEVLQQLKDYIDNSNIGQANALSQHKASGDHDIRYYTKTLLDAGQLDNRYFTRQQLTGGQLDERYYTKEDLVPWLRGGDTNIKEEVFTIVSSDNGDGTFTYRDTNNNLFTQPLTVEGYQVFELREGFYEPGNNRIEIIVGDTLRRSEKSGGLIGIDSTHVALTQPEGAEAEITIKYYERIGIMAEYNIKMGEVQPPLNNGRNMWIEITG